MSFQHNSLVRFMPTYRLEPKHPFNAEKCEKILKTAIEAALEEFEYSTEAANQLAFDLSENILVQVKKLNYDR